MQSVNLNAIYANADVNILEVCWYRSIQECQFNSIRIGNQVWQVLKLMISMSRAIAPKASIV